jgi:hypothetical protein
LQRITPKATDQEIRNFLGDKLDSFKSQKDAEKSAMKVIKELT